jgi:multisubunit Na+/H+ antiporter MnhF subunit
MNVWLWAACCTVVLLAPCMAVALRAPLADAVVALETAGALSVVAVSLAAEGLGESYVWDMAIVLAFVQLVGSLLFVRYLERGL